MAARFDDVFEMRLPCAAPAPMGLAAGGRMKQEIYEDAYSPTVWDLDHSARCFVTLLNAETWPAVTGEPSPTEPITAATYYQHGIPWFDYYRADAGALAGSSRLAGLKTVVDAAKFGLAGKAWEQEEVLPSAIGIGPHQRPVRKSNEVRQADF
jgi:hypothetical protein